jgi:hypothetical protein
MGRGVRVCGVSVQGSGLRVHGEAVREGVVKPPESV